MKEDLTWVARLVRPDLHSPAANAKKAPAAVAQSSQHTQPPETALQCVCPPQQPLVAQPDMGARAIVLTVLFFAINLSAPFLLAAVLQRLRP